MYHCKYCNTKFTRKRSRNIHEKRCPYIDKIRNKKRCRKCNEIISLSEFTRNKNQFDNLNGKCRACANSYQNLWYQKNVGKNRFV